MDSDRKQIMGEIRKFQESDIPEVAALELKVFRRRNGPAPSSLQEYFREIFFKNPWRDERVQALVYSERGSIIGFLGAVPRTMMFRNRPILVAATSQFMIDRERHRGFAGLELMRQFLNGPQDLSLNDGATEDAHAIWTAAGGCVARLYSLEWTRVLRPMRHFNSLLRRKQGLWRMLGMLARPEFALADAGLSKLLGDRFAKPNAALRAETVGADQLFQCIHDIGWRDVLKPNYDAASFRWLMQQAAQARRHGTLRMLVVRDSTESVVGWFAYYAKPGGESKVLQIGSKRMAVDHVIDALMQDAWMQRATAITGQAIPRFLWNLSNHYCRFQYPGSGVLVHARDPEILASVFRGDAALSRLDGEWWMRFAVDDWS